MEQFWQLIALTMAIIGHGAATVWFAATLSANIKELGGSVVRIEKELEKRDSQITAIWKRIDDLRDLIPSKI